MGLRKYFNHKSGLTSCFLFEIYRTDSSIAAIPVRPSMTAIFWINRMELVAAGAKVSYSLIKGIYIVIAENTLRFESINECMINIMML